jgi:alanine dehydrogenase
MHHAGERRGFLPPFVRELERLGAGEVVLEEGYGEAMGVRPGHYLGLTERTRFGDVDDVLSRDVVLVLRCPPEDQLQRMQTGALLISMLHYATRPLRNDLLGQLGLRAISLDSITDDAGRRLIENLEITAWAGVEAAIRELADRWVLFATPGRGPIHVTVLGSGALGGHAVHAATRYGSREVRTAMQRSGVPGVEVAVVDRDLTWHEEYMLSRLAMTDVLVDATFRADPSAVVVPNRWLGHLPDHAVILDLAADPYDSAARPPAVKGIEGIPHGGLEGFIFPRDHEAWDRLEASIGTTNRRLALSCDAWPGLRPEESMTRYGQQLEAVMEVVLGDRPASAWDVTSPHPAERAVARAELERWTRRHHA